CFISYDYLIEISLLLAMGFFILKKYGVSMSISVSYTHLDVYKRQSGTWSLGRSGSRCSGNFE
ncbi:hypothetical protein, partial [Enterococcus sp. 12F9_DIV0723]|uniref:hypothetical protein n=1 Tax=Enterococcus sp. 12F9_DIV0723 TaxID=1834169 RepID=UPI001C3C387E